MKAIRLIVVRLILTIVLISTFSCDNEKINNKIIEYNIEQGINENEHVYLSEIADNIIHIPLETKKECLIADIRNIVFSSNFILISDDMDQVLLFNNQGKFIKRIGQKGRGPNEYLNAWRIRLSQKNNEIYIYDAITPKIMVFDIESGECKKSSTISFYPSDFEIFKDDWLAFYCSAATFPFSKEYYHILVMDVNTLKVTDKLYPRKDLMDSEINENSGFVKMYGFNNKLFCWDSNLDTIFSINNNKEIQRNFHISYKKFEKPSDKKNHSINSTEKGNFFSLDFLLETKNYLFLEGIYQGRYMRNILYDKKTGVSKNIVFNYDIHDKGFHNDIDGSIPFWPKGLAGNNRIYDYISPIQLKKIMKEDYFNSIPINNQEKNNEILNILNNSHITDNPIIFVLKLKE